MGRGLIDKILRFMGVQAEPEEAPAEESPPEQKQETPRWPKKRTPAPVVSFPGQKSQMRVVVLEPLSYDEAQVIADHLKARRPVVLRVFDLDRDLAKRIVDFASGTIYALDGSIHRLGEGIYFFAPPNVLIEADDDFNSDEFFKKLID
ncbi:MAG: cell division protein SepF [Limnochordia bacterium]|jgi:cell division inhibitor SepF